MQARSIKGNSTEEINTALQQTLANGFKPTQATVFISKKQDHAAIIKLLNNEGIAIFGATNNGEFIDGDTGMGAIAILLLDMNPSYFKILLEDYNKKETGSVTKAMMKAALQEFTNPAFILSHGITVLEGLTIGEPIIRSMEEVA